MRDSVSVKIDDWFFFLYKRDVPEFYYENQIRTADIRILPEIVLPHPIYGYVSNSLSKFRLNGKMNGKLLKHESYCTSWPSFVFDVYDVNRVISKIKTFLATLKIGKCTFTCTKYLVE